MTEEIQSVSRTGRNLDYERERFFRQRLAELQRSYQARAQIYIDALVEIEKRKPPEPIILNLDLSQIEERVLATIQEKANDETVRRLQMELEEDDPCPQCGKQLGDGPGGGAVCPDKECGYWFCY